MSDEAARKVRRMHVSPELLAQMLHLPKGAALTPCVRFDPVYRAFEFLVSSEEFEPVREGDAVPRVTVSYTTCHREDGPHTEIIDSRFT